MPFLMPTSRYHSLGLILPSSIVDCRMGKGVTNLYVGPPTSIPTFSRNQKHFISYQTIQKYITHVQKHTFDLFFKFTLGKNSKAT